MTRPVFYAEHEHMKKMVSSTLVFPGPPPAGSKIKKDKKIKKKKKKEREREKR